MIDLREIPLRYFELEVRRGNIPGVSIKSIKGHDENLDTTKITVYPEAMTDDIDQSSINRTSGTPATVKFSSTSVNDTSAGTGLRTAIIYGLDADGYEQTETITMNGQTGGTTSKTWSAINDAKGETWGSLGANDGIIYIGTGTITNGTPETIFCAMEAGFNKTFTAYYTVPVNKKYYPYRLITNLIDSNKDLETYIESSVNGTNWFTDKIGGTGAGSTPEVPVNGDGYSGGESIRVEARASGASTDVHVELFGWLVDD